MFSIKAKFDVSKAMKDIEDGIRDASKRALNETAKLMANDARDRFSSVFDRPIDRTINAVKVFRRATDDRLEVEIGVHDGNKGYAIDDPRARASGKGSIFPNRYLMAQFTGGRRVNKRFENALIKAGVMPSGMQAVFAERSGYLDPFGNLPAAKINQILSYFAAFPESGYRANMTAKNKDRLRLGTRNRKTGEVKFANGRKWGVAYFVSRGERSGSLGMRLPPGVWERNYPNGTAGKSFIKPVLLFVRPGNFPRRFDFHREMRESALRHLPNQFEDALQRELNKVRW